MKTVTIEVPSARDGAEVVRLLRLELSLAVYSAGTLSPGRAAELAGIGRHIAKSRGVFTPYTSQMIEEDFAHSDRH